MGKSKGEIVNMINTENYFLYKWYSDFMLKEINKNGIVEIIPSRLAKTIIKEQNLKVIDKTVSKWKDNYSFVFAYFVRTRRLL